MTPKTKILISLGFLGLGITSFFIFRKKESKKEEVLPDSKASIDPSDISKNTDTEASTPSVSAPLSNPKANSKLVKGTFNLGAATKVSSTGKNEMDLAKAKYAIAKEKAKKAYYDAKAISDSQFTDAYNRIRIYGIPESDLTAYVNGVSIPSSIQRILFGSLTNPTITVDKSFISMAKNSATITANLKTAYQNISLPSGSNFSGDLDVANADKFEIL